VQHGDYRVPGQGPRRILRRRTCRVVGSNLTDYGSVLAWLRDVDAKNTDVQISGGVSLSPSALRHFVYTEWARINGARGVRVRVGCSGVVWCIYDVPSVLRE
jgi:hypothetical protein